MTICKLKIVGEVYLKCLGESISKRETQAFLSQGLLPCPDTSFRGKVKKLSSEDQLFL